MVLADRALAVATGHLGERNLDVELAGEVVISIAIATRLVTVALVPIAVALAPIAVASAAVHPVPVQRGQPRKQAIGDAVAVEIDAVGDAVAIGVHGESVVDPVVVDVDDIARLDPALRALGAAARDEQRQHEHEVGATNNKSPKQADCVRPTHANFSGTLKKTDSV